MCVKMMKKIWFKRKKYGWGWTFGTWESFVVFGLYVVINIFLFVIIDPRSHSGSDTLINFVPSFLALTAVFYFICWWKGEKPRWRWGNRVENETDILRNGGIAVIPTDTTYGIVGSALNERTVNEIYRLRKRDLDKPFIVLLACLQDLKKFGVKTTEAQRKILVRVWPGPVSVVLPTEGEKFAYLHRGKHTIAFRVPKKRSLRKLLQEVGPLVAPSANPQDVPVAKNIAEAKAYFGHHVSFYKDKGDIVSVPSRIIDIAEGVEKVLRW